MFDSGSMQCEYCAAGFFGNVTGLVDCFPCMEGTYSHSGAFECKHHKKFNWKDYIWVLPCFAVALCVVGSIVYCIQRKRRARNYIYLEDPDYEGIPPLLTGNPGNYPPPYANGKISLHSLL